MTSHDGHRGAPIPTVAEIQANMGQDWSADVRAFAAHWAEMREGGRVTTFERFISEPSPRFAPPLYVVELDGLRAVVRLQGTELDRLWGDNLTGKDLHVGFPEAFRVRSVANMRAVTGRPCGYLARNIYATTREREVTADMIQLPLDAGAGRLPRVLCYTPLPVNDAVDERVGAFVRTTRLGWIDLGAGVPDVLPLDLVPDKPWSQD